MSIDRDADDGEVLSRAACLELLASVPIVRLGVTIGALPVVVPVAFSLEHDRLLVRTRRDTDVAAALRNAVVAVEADHYDAIGQAGWNVLVQGVAQPADEVVGGPWSAGFRPCALAEDQLVSITTDIVTGRRVRHVVAPPPMAWWVDRIGD